MPWTDLPATSETDFTDYAFRAQFAEAIVERRAALGEYAGGFPGPDPIPHYSIDETLAGIGNAPPESPAPGDRWAVQDQPTGAWAGHPNIIAEWEGSAWSFETPEYYCNVQARTGVYQYQGSYTGWYHWEAVKAAGHALSPATMQDTLEYIVCKFVRPSEAADYAGVSEAPRAYYPLSEWWTNIGIPAEGRPAEDCEIVTSPPSSPRDGERCAVGSGATGDFAGHDADIATAHKQPDGSYTWTFETPPDGYRIIRIWSDEPWGLYRRDAATLSWVNVYPADRGWTRKYPREIQRTSDDGEAGQQARLVGTGNRINFSYTHSAGPYMTPPENPSTGVRYAVQQGATSAWTGHDGQVAWWDGSAWQFDSYADGQEFVANAQWWSGFKTFPNSRTYLKEGIAWLALGEIYEHDGSAWVRSADQNVGPDTLTAHGQAQEGDYVGPWLFNELQAGVNLLTHRLSGGPSAWGGVGTLSKTSGSDWESEWSEAKAATEVEWAAEPPPTPGGGDSYYPAWAPKVYNGGEGGHGGSYAAFASRYQTRQRGVLTYDDRRPRKVNVDFYAIGTYAVEYDPTKRISEFDAHGDNVAFESAVKWDGLEAADAAGQYLSAVWAQTRANACPAPPWCQDPDNAPIGLWGRGWTYKGYFVNDSFVVENSAVADGFEYQ